MRALVALMLVAAAFATFPTVAAHDCTGSDCGACTGGESHNHSDPAGAACSSSKAGLPFPGVLLVGAVVVVAAVVSRARLN